MKQTISAFLLSAILLTSCASHSDDISAQYVSPMEYQSYNCNQIRLEMQRVSRRVNEIAGVQDSQATKDSVAPGVGLVLFWPALFFMIGKDKQEELSRLKGEYEALEQAAIGKECNVAKEIETAKKMQEERKAKQQQYQQEQGQVNQ